MYSGRRLGQKLDKVMELEIEKERWGSSVISGCRLPRSMRLAGILCLSNLVPPLTAHLYLALRHL